MTHAVLQAVERFLLPNVCVACEGPIERPRPDGLVCGVCRTRLGSLVGGCDRCAQPIPPVGPCRFCADWPEVLTWVRSAVWLSDQAREIVHHLKYEGYRALADEMTEIIVQRTSRPPRGILVPIPLGHRRLASRGYNQAAEIARALAARWALPLSETLLRRTRETKTQTALAPEERERNVRGAFVAASPPPSQRAIGGDERRWRAMAAPRAPSTPPSPEGKGWRGEIILIDDVLTTGATLAAAARSLEQSGWKQIGAVTFARALSYGSRAGS